MKTIRLEILRQGPPHNQLLSRNQGEHRVGRSLSRLDQITVNQHGVAVEARNFNHWRDSSIGALSARD